MANLTAGLEIKHKANPTKASLITAVAATWRAGQIAFLDLSGAAPPLFSGTGYAVPTLGGEDEFAGIVTSDQVVAAGASVEVWVEGLFIFPSALSAALVGAGGGAVYAVTNNPADVVLGGGAGAGPLVGRVCGFEGGLALVVLA